MKIITLGTLKGGTGKTATLFNLAGLLAENHKILLIDCDPQTNLSLNCGVDITIKSRTREYFKKFYISQQSDIKRVRVYFN